MISVSYRQVGKMSRKRREIMDMHVSVFGPDAAAGIAALPLPVPERAQLLRRVLRRGQHVHVTLLLTQPA